MKLSFAQFLKNKEFSFVVFFFVLIWTYLIVRANTVFYIHDEIVTKWAYMIDWNFLPFSGYQDANNHFLNSFLGGLLYRLTQSDSMLVIRLGNLICFPVYFWSIYGLKSHFSHKSVFYSFLITLTTSAFLIEYFGLARGYGMAIAFLMLVISQMFNYLKSKNKRTFYILLVANLIMVTASLTLLPVAIFIIGYLSIYSFQRRAYKNFVGLLLSFLPCVYFIQYSLHLKDIGKLYYGEQDGFIVTTIQSLSPYLWGIDNYWFAVGITILGGVILLYWCVAFFRNRNLFASEYFFPILLLISIANILLQHLLLGVNFPEDRAALYLVISFLGAIFFTIDRIGISSIGKLLMVIAIFLFIRNINFSNSIFFDYEHFDEKLLTTVPDRIDNIAPTTGGRFWIMDNELSRTMGFPMKAFQNSDSLGDTLVDFMIHRPDLRPELLKMYQPVFKDQVSGLVLFERKKKLEKNLLQSKEIQLSQWGEFTEFYAGPNDQQIVVNLKGKLENMSIHHAANIVFTVESNTSNELVYYESIGLEQSQKIDENGSLYFDFSYVLRRFSGDNRVKVYYWNKRKLEVLGNVTMSIYSI